MLCDDFLVVSKYGKLSAKVIFFIIIIINYYYYYLLLLLLFYYYYYYYFKVIEKVGLLSFFLI